MQLYNQWIPGTEYSFSSTAQAVLPQRYTFVKLGGVCTFSMALAVGGQAIYAQWRRVFPYLGTGVVDDPSQYDWLFFTASNGEDIILANPWIEASSVTPVSFRQERITLTETNEVQLTRVRDFLDAIGAKYTSVPVA